MTWDFACLSSSQPTGLSLKENVNSPPNIVPCTQAYTRQLKHSFQTITAFQQFGHKGLSRGTDFNGLLGGQPGARVQLCAAGREWWALFLLAEQAQWRDVHTLTFRLALFHGPEVVGIPEAAAVEEALAPLTLTVEEVAGDQSSAGPWFIGKVAGVLLLYKKT